MQPKLIVIRENLKHKTLSIQLLMPHQSLKRISNFINIDVRLNALLGLNEKLVRIIDKNMNNKLH